MNQNQIQNIFGKYEVKTSHVDAFEDLCYEGEEAEKWVNCWRRK